MRIVERIKKLVDEKSNGNKKEFSSIIGIVQVTFNRYVNEERAVGIDAVSAILSAFPDVSAEWLLRGEGEMLKSNTNTSPINADGDLKTDVEMEKEIRRLRASLDLALEKNERLEAELAGYKAKEVSSKETA